MKKISKLGLLLSLVFTTSWPLASINQTSRAYSAREELLTVENLSEDKRLEFSDSKCTTLSSEVEAIKETSPSFLTRKETTIAYVGALAVELQAAKDAAIAEINALVNGLDETKYSTGDWQTILDAQAQAIANINAATTVFDVNEAKEIGIAIINAILTLEEVEALELQAIKDAAKAEINAAVDALDPEEYTEDEWQEILDAQAKALQSIEDAIELDEVKTAKDLGIEEIQAVTPTANLEEVTMWPVIIFLGILIIIEMLIVVLKKRDDNKKKNEKKAASSLIPLIPVLATIFDPAGWLIVVIIEVVIILALFGVIIYTFSKKDDDQVEKIVEKETTIIKETVIEKETVVAPTVTPVAAPVVSVTPVAAPVPEGVGIMYDYSFLSRLHLNDEETDARYNELKNHLLSYEGVSDNVSWKQETFVYKGKMVARLRLQGKTLRVFLSVDPKTLDSKYHIEDKSDIKSLASTPTLQIVKGPRQLAHAMQLVDLSMKELGGEKLREYEVKDFTVKKINRERLIEMKLIRILGNSGEFASIKEAAVFDKPKPQVVPVVTPLPEEDKVIYDYSFMSRLHLNDEETDARYNELKNRLLSYEGVSTNMSWKQETFVYKGKMVARLRLQGKTLRVFLSVDSKTLDPKYRVDDKSDIKSLSSTPTLQIVKGPRQLAHAMQLVDLSFEELKGQKINDYKPQKFTVKKLKRETLIEMGLIKIQRGEFTSKD